MAYAEIVEEAKGLSEYRATQVLDYIRLIKAYDENRSIERKSNLLAGGLIFMADDFDDTPECFKEYML